MWGLFLFGTFLTMLVFLNMIIAIMGNTYDNVLDNWERSGLIERTAIYADYMSIVNKSSLSELDSFLYVVTRKE